MFSNLKLAVFYIYFKLCQYLRMIFLQIEFYLLGSVFKKISLHMRGIDILFHLPDQVNVVGHDHEAINKHSVIIY